MSKLRPEKEKIIQELEEKLLRSKGVVFADYFGLKVKEMEELRKKLKGIGAQYLVTKKSLLKLVLKKLGFKNIDFDSLKGGVSLALGYEDEVRPAKVLGDFTREHEALKIQGGLFEGAFIEAQKVAELSRLPTKEELQRKIVWLVKAPLSGLVGVLEGNIRNFVYLLKDIENTKRKTIA